jgi:hypothetical protein
MKRYVLVAPFDVADRGSGQTYPIGELMLRQACMASRLPQALTEGRVELLHVLEYAGTALS